MVAVNDCRRDGSTSFRGLSYPGFRDPVSLGPYGYAAAWRLCDAPLVPSYQMGVGVARSREDQSWPAGY
jgi:hypothetical protein